MFCDGKASVMSMNNSTNEFSMSALIGLDSKEEEVMWSNTTINWVRGYEFNFPQQLNNLLEESCSSMFFVFS